MSTKQKALDRYVTDMIALEEHISDAVGRQLGSDAIAGQSEAASLLTELRSTLHGHLERLGSLSTERDVPELQEKAKQVLGGALGFAAGLYDKVRSAPASRMLRDDYTAISLATASYTMLHTAALGWDNDEIADLAQSHLSDLTPILVRLSEVLARVTASELGAEHESYDASVADQAVENTQKTWNAEHVYA